MERIQNCLMVRFDGRRRKLIIDYVYRDQAVPGGGALLTYIPIKELQAVSPNRAAHRIGKTLLMSLHGVYRAVYEKNRRVRRRVTVPGRKMRAKRPS